MMIKDFFAGLSDYRLAALALALCFGTGWGSRAWIDGLRHEQIRVMMGYTGRLLCDVGDRILEINHERMKPLYIELELQLPDPPHLNGEIGCIEFQKITSYGGL